MTTPSRHAAPGSRAWLPDWAPATVLVAVLALVLMPAQSDAGPRRPRESSQVANADPRLEGDAREFIQRLIEEFGYTDLARLWIAARMTGASARAKGDLDYFRCDCERVDGDVKKMGECLERAARHYPSHPRSLVTKIIGVEAKLFEVIQLGKHARAVTDEQARKDLIADRDRVFKEQVVAPIEAALESGGNSSSTPEPLTPQQSRLRQSWGLLRVRAHQLYGELLDPSDSNREKVLKKALEHAIVFVEDDADALDLQCKGQLLRGNILAALGDYQEAAETFETLVTIRPGSDPPYPDSIVEFIVTMRLQASQGMSRAYVQAGKPESAIAVFENIRENPDTDFQPSNMSNPDTIRELVLKSEIEEGVARLSGGDPAIGGEIFDRLIGQYDGPQFTATLRQANERFIGEVHVGLSRAVDFGVRSMRAQLFYRAGLGFKARIEFDKAIAAWRMAVAAGSRVSADDKWVALSLYEMGESSLLLDRREEAVVAYMMLLETFETELLRPHNKAMASKAAQNAYATVSQLAEKPGGVWVEIEKDANRYFKLLGSGEARFREFLGEAAKRELEGKYEVARRKYLDIPREFKNSGGEQQRVSFYCRARAGAARCLFRSALTGGDDVAAAQEQAAAELEKLAREARAAHDMAGAAAVSYEWGNVYWPIEKGKEPFRNADKAIAALAPLRKEIRGTSEYRQGGLLLWTQILIHQDKLDEAGRVFASLHKDFPGSDGEISGAINLIDAHTEKGMPEDRAAAARYAVLYVDSPGIDIATMVTAELLWFAQRLMDGNNFPKALMLIEQAQKSLGENPEPAMEVLIARLLGQAANKSGDHQKCLDTLLPVFQKHSANISNGVFEDAPYLLWEMAKAKIQLHNKTRKVEHLERALEYLMPACGTLQARRASTRPDTPPELERAYWSCELQRLKVLWKMEHKENVCKEISTFRMMAGNKDFAPDDLMPRFKKLEDQCQ